MCWRCFITFRSLYATFIIHFSNFNIFLLPSYSWLFFCFTHFSRYLGFALKTISIFSFFLFFFLLFLLDILIWAHIVYIKKISLWISFRQVFSEKKIIIFLLSQHSKLSKKIYFTSRCLEYFWAVSFNCLDVIHRSATIYYKIK